MRIIWASFGGKKCWACRTRVFPLIVVVEWIAVHVLRYEVGSRGIGKETDGKKRRTVYVELFLKECKEKGKAKDEYSKA